MKMSKSVKVGIIASLIAVVVVGCITSMAIGDMMSLHEKIDVYYVLYRLTPICGNIARVAIAITLPVIGTQVAQAIKKGE